MESLLPLAESAARLLKSRGETVGVAESSTGGLISAALLALGGASAYFKGGGVIYTADARQGLLGLPTPLPPPVGRPATEAYAQLLAESARARLNAVWGIGETGATGPSANRYGDAPGHCCIAVSGPVAKVITIETGSAERAANMREFARAALVLLTEAVGEAG
ncbi:MAG TPA: CinA family protein [Acidisoma sp.]|uniref:CinA family protein n=1 Tax=Acidisoma sp. TaxID=1872115 RepID=UPI002BD0B68C|nr:CinA family protein [Acidisoma sp.]HTI00314.1 CinA family protein [Acidisoma sp.]